MIGVLFITGCVVGGAVFGIGRALMIARLPIRDIPQDSEVAKQIDMFKRRNLELQGSSTAKNASNSHSSVAQKPSTSAERNYARWAKKPSNIPLIMDGIRVLKTLAAISVLDLSVEEAHDVEVLSDQTNELLTNYIQTPESIRMMPVVEKALLEQLQQIQESLTHIQGDGAARLVRELKTGTEFLKSKFQK